MATLSLPEERVQNILLLLTLAAQRTGSAVPAGGADTLPCSTRGRCTTIGGRSQTERSKRSKADRADSTRGWNIRALATARLARATARVVARIRPTPARAPNATD